MGVSLVQLIPSGLSADQQRGELLENSIEYSDEGIHPPCIVAITAPSKTEREARLPRERTVQVPRRETFPARSLLTPANLPVHIVHTLRLLGELFGLWL